MLTDTTFQALRVVICLALSGNRAPVSNRELAGLLDASESYLSKIVTQLTKRRILLSQRGPGGGVYLSRAPEEITLLDVVRACEGTTLAFQPMRNAGGPSICALHRAMLDLERMVADALAGWTIAQMLGGCEPGHDATCRGRCVMSQVAEAARALARP